LPIPLTAAARLLAGGRRRLPHAGKALLDACDTSIDAGPIDLRLDDGFSDNHLI
jgi:hypothetical protein